MIHDSLNYHMHINIPYTNSQKYILQLKELEFFKLDSLSWKTCLPLHDLHTITMKPDFHLQKSTASIDFRYTFLFYVIIF